MNVKKAEVVHPLTGRSKEAGCKIVILDKSADKTREGSKNALFFKIISESKTTDEAVVEIRKYMDKPWDVIRMAVARGFIELAPQGSKEKAVPKAKPAPIKEKSAKPVGNSVKAKPSAKPKAAAKETKLAAEKAPKARSTGRRASDAAAKEVSKHVAEMSAQAALGATNAMVAGAQA